MAWWKSTTATLLGVSFVTYRRRRRDILMGRRVYVIMRRLGETFSRRRGDVPMRHLGDVPPKCRWLFHLRRTCHATGTYKEASLRRRYDVLLTGGWSFSFQPANSFSNFFCLVGDTNAKRVKTFRRKYTVIFDSDPCELFKSFL